MPSKITIIPPNLEGCYTMTKELILIFNNSKIERSSETCLEWFEIMMKSLIRMKSATFHVLATNILRYRNISL